MANRTLRPKLPSRTDWLTGDGTRGRRRLAWAGEAEWWRLGPVFEAGATIVAHGWVFKVSAISIMHVSEWRQASNPARSRFDLLWAGAVDVATGTLSIVVHVAFDRLNTVVGPDVLMVAIGSLPGVQVGQFRLFFLFFPSCRPVALEKKNCPWMLPGMASSVLTSRALA